MKKYLCIIFILLVAEVGMLAKDLKLNEAEDIERFYYNKGYKDGYGKAYKEGYERAYMDFRRKLRKYKNDLKAVEAGKYLYEEGKLKYPRVYRVRGGDGSYTVKIVPPKIEGELALKELAKIPEKYISDGGSDDWESDEVGKEKDEVVADNSSIVKKKKNSWFSDVVNSFREVGEERGEGVEFSSSKINKRKVSVLFEKSEDLMSALDKSNLNYELKGKNMVVVKFGSDADYNRFCQDNFDGECK